MKDKVGQPDIDTFFRKHERVVVALTVQEIPDEEITTNLG